MTTIVSVVLLMIVCQQLCRQVMPNAFRYLWQLYGYRFVPNNLDGRRRFADKESLLFLPRAHGFKWQTQTIFTSANIRNVVLIGGVALIVLNNIVIEELFRVWPAVNRFLVVYFVTMTVMASCIFVLFKENYVERSIYLLFDSMGLYLAVVVSMSVLMYATGAA